MEELLLSLFFAAVCAGAIGFFYFMLFKAKGFQFSYKYIALILGVTTFIPGLFDYKFSVYVLIGFGFGLFVLAIGLTVWQVAASMGRFTASMQQRIQGEGPVAEKTSFSILNYYGTAFHSIIAILIFISLYYYSKEPAISNQRMEALIADSSFQFNTTLLLVFIGIFNPFVAPSAFLVRIVNRIDQQRFGYWHGLLSNTKVLTAIKAVLCIGLICYFKFNGYFGLPEWGDGGIYMDGATVLTCLFIFVSIIQLIKNPMVFFMNNIFRVIMVWQSAVMGIFVAALFVIPAYLTIGDGYRTGGFEITSEAFLFLGYNCIMAFNEYKIARGRA